MNAREIVSKLKGRWNPDASSGYLLQRGALGWRAIHALLYGLAAVALWTVAVYPLVCRRSALSRRAGRCEEMNLAATRAWPEDAARSRPPFPRRARERG